MKSTRTLRTLALSLFVRFGAILTATIAMTFCAGCALYADQDALQKRVVELENRVKKLESDRIDTQRETTERRQKLETCVGVDADEAFWEYVRFNGTKNKEGTYSAPQYVWDQARRRKLDKIEECKLLYADH